MPIVSSDVIEDSRQHDGRRWIAERLVDQSGQEHVFRYLAEADYQPDLAARSAALTESMRQDEIAANLQAVATLGRDAQPTFAQSSAAENATAVREAFRDMTQLAAIMTGDYLASLSDTQLRSAFGLNAGQVNTLRANKLTPAANAAATIRAATGA